MLTISLFSYVQHYKAPNYQKLRLIDFLSMCNVTLRNAFRAICHVLT